MCQNSLAFSCLKYVYLSTIYFIMIINLNSLLSIPISKIPFIISYLYFCNVIIFFKHGSDHCEVLLRPVQILI
jgi:hypothetical protein